MGCLVDLAEQTGVIVRKGAWYSYEGDNIGQGRENTIQRLQEDAEFAQKVEAQVREKLEIGGAAVGIADDEIEVETEEDAAYLLEDE
jgi:recombination protein RecA